MSEAILGTLCLWIAYTTNTPPPPEALVVGFYQFSRKWKTSPLYAVRFTDQGEEMTFGWQRIQHAVEMHATRGFIDVHVRHKRPAEILTCPGPAKDKLRWVQYDPKSVDLGRCLELGNNANGERTYLARVYVSDRPPARAYLPAIFVPLVGLAVTENQGTYATDDVKLLCDIEPEEKPMSDDPW